MSLPMPLLLKQKPLPVMRELKDVFPISINIHVKIATGPLICMIIYASQSRPLCLNVKFIPEMDSAKNVKMSCFYSRISASPNTPLIVMGSYPIPVAEDVPLLPLIYQGDPVSKILMLIIVMFIPRLMPVSIVMMPFPGLKLEPVS
jgi:hypothetical protein